MARWHDGGNSLMIDYRMVVQTCATLFLGSSSIAWAAGHDMMQPRVPPENMAEARADESIAGLV